MFYSIYRGFLLDIMKRRWPFGFKIQPEIADDPVDDLRLFDKRDDSHLSTTCRTIKWIHFVNLADNLQKSNFGGGALTRDKSFLRLHWLCLDLLTPDDRHFRFDLPAVLSRDGHVINKNDHKIRRFPDFDRFLDVFRKPYVGITMF